MNPSNSKSLELVASALAKDNRVAEAKRLLCEALAEQQKKITQIRPPIPALKQSYDEMLSSFAEYRGAKLWHPFLGSGIGNGALVELADGSIKYDFICGIGAHYWGHSHPDLLDSGIDAALSDTVMQGHLQQNVDALELTALLVKASKLDHCFLTTSGALANENALKIAFQKKHPASRVLAFDRCFVGRTLALSQITDKPSFREGLPLNMLVDYVPFFDPLDPEGSTRHALTCIKKYIDRYPKAHAVMCFEFIQGEAGFHAGTQQFFKEIMTLLKNHDIAILADEVQTFGRTGELFAYQHFGLEEFIDIATIGKLTQTCATLYRSEFKPRIGLLSQTFTASTSAIKASLVILKGLIHGGYYGPNGKIAVLHTYFAHKLDELSKRYPKLLHGPFGCGCMIAFTPYNGDSEKVTKFVHRLFDAGVISFIAGGGAHHTRVRFLIPAGAVTQDDIDRVMEIVERTLQEDME